MIKRYIIFDFAGTLVKMRPATLLVNPTLLRKLKSDFNLGIVTGAKRSETINILTKLNIKYLFTSIVTADDSKYRKPNPNLFVSKPTLYIGDTKKDELLAKNANIPFYRINKKIGINQIIKFLLK